MAQITVDKERIAAFCRQHHIRRLALFGSVLRAHFRPDSDVDVLVTFEEDHPWSLFDIVTMQDELAEIFGREVDLVEKKAVVQSPNYIRRRHVLSNMEVLHVAG